MKKIIIVLAILLSTFTFAQEKYLTRTGTVVFEASVPSFEEVKAKNEATTAILNTDNGEFAALVLVKGFRFKNALMEEHFNENYAESDDFPKATFKGKLIDFSKDNLSASVSSFTYEGNITFHGETKTLENVAINVKRNEDDSLLLTGELILNVDDFNIEIPSVVSKKLSKEVKTKFEFTLKKK